MVAHLRVIVALLTLFAFGSAEAARAMAFAASEAATAASCMSAMADACAHGSHEDDDGATGDCPSMPAGMTSVCTATAAALHETKVELRAFVPEQRLQERSDDLPVLFEARRLFRPPRA